MNIDVVITRHPALVEYLLDEKIIQENTKVVEHVTIPEMVQGKNVLGVLPHNLSCLCESFTEVPLRLPSELRGKELTIDQIRQYASDPVTYKVTRI